MVTSVGNHWIDFSGLRPDPHDPGRYGAKGVCRYISALKPDGTPKNKVAWKVATRAECESYLAAGLDVVLNYEWYEGRMLEGAEAGRQDGIWALSQATAIGYPTGASIYFSHDTGVVDIPAIAAYLSACQQQLGDAYRVDIYSGSIVYEEMKRRGLVRYGWQAMASSWSNHQIGSAALLQNGRYWYNKNADENEVKSVPFGSWLQTKNGHPATHDQPHVEPNGPPGPPMYQVVAGDTLSALAARFGTSVHQLVAWNQDRHPSLATNPDLIRVGWILRVGWA
jgi:hypothetical protein